MASQESGSPARNRRSTALPGGDLNCAAEHRNRRVSLSSTTQVVHTGDARNLATRDLPPRPLYDLGERSILPVRREPVAVTDGRGRLPEPSRVPVRGHITLTPFPWFRPESRQAKAGLKTCAPAAGSPRSAQAVDLAGGFEPRTPRVSRQVVALAQRSPRPVNPTG